MRMQLVCLVVVGMAVSNPPSPEAAGLKELWLRVGAWNTVSKVHYPEATEFTGLGNGRLVLGGKYLRQSILEADGGELFVFTTYDEDRKRFIKVHMDNRGGLPYMTEARYDKSLDAYIETGQQPDKATELKVVTKHVGRQAMLVTTFKMEVDGSETKVSETTWNRRPRD